MSEIAAVGPFCTSAIATNLGATYPSANHVFYSRMKHLAIDYHFVRDLVQSSELCVVHVFAGDQLTDALTKPLSRSRLFSLCNKTDVTLTHHLKKGY